MTDELDELLEHLVIGERLNGDGDVLERTVEIWKDGEITNAKQAIQALIDRECNKARIDAFDVAFDCHDYDRLRAYRAELLKEVK